MRALVIGGDAYIGRALCTQLLERGHTVVKTTRHDNPDAPVRHRESIIHLDLCELLVVEAVHSLLGGGEVVYVLAAITGIMRCEEHTDAWLVNAEVPAIIAREASMVSGRRHVVFISSGTVERAQHTALARQKSYADAAVLAAGGCVVRPLPHVDPERLPAFCGLLIQVGEQRRAGLVRWATDPEGWWK